MNEKDDAKKHKCQFCNYGTKRKFDLKRHHNNKHPDKNYTASNFKNTSNNIENVFPNIENVFPNIENVFPNTENVISNKMQCKKCNKTYKTLLYLINHEKNCNGIDNLTCSKCMKSFSNRKTKSKHILRNNCKARSIIYARVPNAQNITNCNNNNITNNTTNNNIDNSIKNNITINIFGNERIDYLTFDKVKDIFVKGSKNSIPLLITEKHFNKDFPENNNIKGVKNKNSKCLVKIEDDWFMANISIISDKLIKENSEYLLHFSNTNKKELGEIILNEELYDFYNEKLIQIKNKSDKDEYKHMQNKVKDIIYNST